MNNTQQLVPMIEAPAGYTFLSYSIAAFAHLVFKAGTLVPDDQVDFWVAEYAEGRHSSTGPEKKNVLTSKVRPDANRFTFEASYRQSPWEPLTLKDSGIAYVDPFPFMASNPEMM
jgi:hypothetical protein